MRKLRPLVWLVVVILSLSACSGPASPTPTNTGVTTNTTIPTTASTVAATAASTTAATAASAQAAVGICSQTVSQALETVKGRCNAIGANQVCYGNPDLEATTLNSVSFKAPGDIVQLSDLKTIRTRPYNAETKSWGIAVMRTAANLAGTTAGQQVTLLLYGDTTVDSITADMKTVVFRTGIGKQTCDELPASGLIVQVPRGGKISFTINGADINLGSTAVFQAQPDDELSVSVLEGQAEVTSQGVTEKVPAGFRTGVALKGTTASAAPEVPEPIPVQDVKAVPAELLPQPVTQAQIQQAIASATVQPSPTVRPTRTPAGPVTPQASITPQQTWTPGPTLAQTTGLRLAFATNAKGSFNISVINPDGSSSAPLTNRQEDNRSPAWSPDGKQIAFVAFSGPTLRISTVAVENGTVQPLTPDNISADHPAWSPDGRFVAYDALVNGNRDIWIIGSDGSGAKAITTDPADDSQPAWSPDGQRIAFVSRRDGNKEIYVMNADGSQQMRLTNNPGDDTHPVWSPDGKRIAFASTRSGNGDIYVMNADGSNVQRVVGNAATDDEPVWSPDGEQMAFVSNREGPMAIYITGLKPDDKPRRLTELSADNTDPAWQH